MYTDLISNSKPLSYFITTSVKKEKQILKYKKLNVQIVKALTHQTGDFRLIEWKRLRLGKKTRNSSQRRTHKS